MKQVWKLPVLLCVALAALAASAASASAWAPESSATVHPGIETFTGASSFLGGASQCTANFVFTDSSGNVYLGQAAHCSSTGEDTETDGCSTQSLPLGTAIYTGDLVNGVLEEGTEIGTLAYNSWLSMQKEKQANADTCAYNDLALIKLTGGQSDANPTVPFWGGPNGLAAGPSAAGETVFTYGNSVLRGGITALSPKLGVSLGEQEPVEGWSEQVYTVSPGIPGDSGSAYMNSSGAALGVLSTVEFAPVPASNGVGTLAKELAYANSATGLGLKVATGTKAFSSIPIP